MIKNIIFDLGNVLLNFKPLEYLCTRVPDKTLAEQVYKEIFQSQEWLMLDRGVITEEEATDRICGRSEGNSGWIRLAMDNWYQLLTPMEDSISLLKDLKDEGYKLFFLSNFHQLAYEDIIRRYEFFKFFDGGIASFKEKSLKPEKEIYEALVKTYGLDPGESIFIDDTLENVEGARRLGFYAIHFIGTVDLKQKLTEYFERNYEK